MAQVTAALIGSNAGFVLLTFIPPILWLLFYLREDRHPEPKLLLIFVFLGGMASAFLALAAECAWILTLSGSCRAGIEPSLNPLLLFTGIAVIEEYVKYVPVKFLVLRRCRNHQVCDFDEPVDAMIYMMTAALGFAALENVLFLLPVFERSFAMSIEVATNRFLGANLLHALSSGMVGFFLARAWFSPRRHHFVALGVLIAAALHAVFNYLILIRGVIPQGTFYLIMLLSTMAVMVFINFERLKKTRTTNESPNE